MVWNRQDVPLDKSRPEDTFTKRLVPFWIITSDVPFPQKVHQRAVLLLPECGGGVASLPHATQKASVSLRVMCWVWCCMV